MSGGHKQQAQTSQRPQKTMGRANGMKGGNGPCLSTVLSRPAQVLICSALSSVSVSSGHCLVATHCVFLAFPTRHRALLSSALSLQNSAPYLSMRQEAYFIDPKCPMIGGRVSIILAFDILGVQSSLRKVTNTSPF